MKIIAVLDTAVTAGGGFNQALNAIMQMQRLCDERYEFEVITSHLDNIEYLKKLGINAAGFSYTFIDNFLEKFRLAAWWQLIQGRLKLIGPFERKLIAHGCDLVYFVAPFEKSGALQQLNYISTVWDTCHRDTPEFPEVRGFNLFQMRERHLRNFLSPAVAILVDSEDSANSLAMRYGVDRDKLQPMPFSPAPLLNSEYATEKESVLRKYGLEEGYFFYPAQFWAHKNHIRILEALLILRKQGQKYRVVFSGGDQGCRCHLENFVMHHQLHDQVCFLGFVPSDEMRGLYEGCQAVIMPTYFGPTNVPPLEAWVIGKPLIYTSWFSNQVGNAAILVDPDDAQKLASGMKQCENKQLIEEMVGNGRARLDHIDMQRNQYEEELRERLARFNNRLQCWNSRSVSKL